MPSQGISEFPDLRGTTRIGVDIETKDPQLKELGPGVRRDGKIVGVSVAFTHDGKPHSHYYPIRHKEGLNYDSEKVFRYLEDNITGPDKEICGANLLYDLDFLAEEGINIGGKLFDVQVAEPLIDENKRGEYDLDSLSEHYLGYGKDDEALYQWLADHHGGKPTRSAQAGRIWMAPGDIAGPYACSDAENPLGIVHQQLKIIEQEKLTQVWELEQALQPMLLAMRRRGVRINRAAAEEAATTMGQRIGELKQLLEDYDIQPTVAASVGAYADLMDIPYPLTAKTKQPSITEAWMQKHADTNDVIAALMEVKKAAKTEGTFIQGLLKHMVGDRVHCQFNQLAGDNYGAVSGRFSSSNPNLQNMPAKDPEMFKLCRGLFIPEEGELWGCSDYSQIEYRMLVEYAWKFFKGGLGSQKMMDRFLEDPHTDIHMAVAMLVFMDEAMRGPGKTINFGMVYGLGLDSLIGKLGFPRERCVEIIDKYHEMMPFAKQIYKDAQSKAKSRGFIRTLGGRVRRFQKWEPFIPWQAAEGTFDDRLKEWMVQDGKKWKRDLSKRPKAMREEAAMAEYAGLVLERSHCHTALNALLQGSAADIMKRAMVDIWDSGVCDVLGAPFLTVHDELNWSVPDNAAGREAFAEANRIMEAVYSDRITIPLVVDSEIGNNWAECK